MDEKKAGLGEVVVSLSGGEQNYRLGGKVEMSSEHDSKKSSMHLIFKAFSLKGNLKPLSRHALANLGYVMFVL